jgi:GNAT superfamily N-acetyltransferase
VDVTSWYELVVRARIRYLLNLGIAPSAVVDDGAGVTTVVSGVCSNTLNGACGARLDAAGAGAAIAGVVARFRERTAPATWYRVPADTPADLPWRLEAAGCRPERGGVVRGAPLERVRARVPDASVDVRPVRTGQDLDRLLDVAASVWGEELDDPPGNRARWRRLLTELGLGPGAPLQHWVAMQAARPVGMLSAFYDPTDEVVLIDHDDVVEDARRQGIGGALIGAALAAPAAHGCRWAVLEPTPQAAAFYSALGFDTEPTDGDREFYLPLAEKCM